MSEKKCKSEKKTTRLSIDSLGPYVLILIAIGMGFAFAVIATDRKLTGFESTMLQAFSLGAGLIGSFIFGKQSAKQAAKELIRPHARSAFRRSMSLYLSLSRLRRTITLDNQKEASVVNNKQVLEKLEAIVSEQIATADDALEDWRDIVPEDVAELTDKVRKTGNDND